MSICLKMRYARPYVDISELSWMTIEEMEKKKNIFREDIEIYADLLNKK